MTTHYHVSRHSNDDDPYITDDLFAALDYAGTELNELADFEHEGLSYIAQQVAEGQTMFDDNAVSKATMEVALLAFLKVERYNGLMANTANMVKQNRAPHVDRAPLYQIDWENEGDGLWPVRAADARLFEAAKRVAQSVNDASPVSITECSADMRTWPEEERKLAVIETYCTDQYPDGYAG
jgi:hypothetical protein